MYPRAEDNEPGPKEYAMRIEENFQTVETFVKAMNKARDARSWTIFTGQVAGKEVAFKAIGTWTQILRVDGVRMESGCMGMKVGAWKEEILKSLA
jgi:hypothetical protein